MSHIRFAATSINILLILLMCTPLANASSTVPGWIKKLVVESENSIGLDRHLILSVIRVESNFDPYAISSAGAKGLMQLMDQTAGEYADNASYDAESNILMGSHYLKKMILRFGSIEKGLHAYNAGPTRVDQQSVPTMSRRYAHKVIGFYKHYKKTGWDDI